VPKSSKTGNICAGGWSFTSRFRIYRETLVREILFYPTKLAGHISEANSRAAALVSSKHGRFGDLLQNAMDLPLIRLFGSFGRSGYPFVLHAFAQAIDMLILAGIDATKP
jgi:hypothetical protein